MKFINNTSKTFKQVIVEYFGITEDFYDKHKKVKLNNYHGKSLFAVHANPIDFCARETILK